MRENYKEEKVKHEMDEIETINIELEHSVAKLLSENERLHKEIEHLKKIYKDKFDSIKKTRAFSKEHGDSLIAQLNSKSMENADLKRQIQDKVFVITSLKNDLQKLKGKEIVENATQIPIVTTIALGMFKIDLDPLDPRLLKNRKAHIDYLKHTQEQTNILRGIVEQAKAKQPLGCNSCPLTRITPKKIVHLKETTSNSVETPKPEIKVYSRRPKQIKSVGSSKKAKIVESKIANNSEPNHLWGSNATDVPSSSSLFNDRLSRFFSAPLFLWAEAINAACYTQNRSLIRLQYNKTPYELMHNKKPDLSFLYVFGSLCYPTNESEDLGKLNAKADIGVFVGYAPTKKAFRIYNRRTRKIMETIHVTFDELTAMDSEQFSLGPELQSMTPATSISRLVPNPNPQQPCNPPKRYDWDHLFQPMFDEYFNPSPSDISLGLVAVAPRAVDIADSLVSTSIDLDAPSTSIPSTQEQEHSPIISQGVEE
ncbi:retrovirus-related pol polyprotein from transposon TNT 1-94 [Tanacetum coccineum]